MSAVGAALCKRMKFIIEGDVSPRSRARAFCVIHSAPRARQSFFFFFLSLSRSLDARVLV